MNTASPPPVDDLEAVNLSPQDLRRILGLKSLQVLWRLVHAGRLPRPDIQLGPKMSRWSRRTVEAFIAEKRREAASAQA